MLRRVPDFQPLANYVTQQADFNGNTSKLLPQDFSGVIYIVSLNGLFRFNNVTNECKKIATFEFVQTNLGAAWCISNNHTSHGPYHRLSDAVVRSIEERTEVACVYRGFLNTTPYDAVYSVIKALISRPTLVEDLKELSDNTHSSRYILSLFAYTGFNLAYYVDVRELTYVQCHNLKACIDPTTVATTCIVVDLIRGLASYKTPERIAALFADYCSATFNDSVLAEQWKQFSDKQLSRKSTDATVLQVLKLEQRQQGVQSVNNAGADESVKLALGQKQQGSQSFSLTNIVVETGESQNLDSKQTQQGLPSYTVIDVTGLGDREYSELEEKEQGRQPSRVL
jgi:hypothetical protein